MTSIELMMEYLYRFYFIISTLRRKNDNSRHVLIFQLTSRYITNGTYFVLTYLTTNIGLDNREDKFY
jgi:hypothetical protein